MHSANFDLDNQNAKLSLNYQKNVDKPSQPKSTMYEIKSESASSEGNISDVSVMNPRPFKDL